VGYNARAELNDVALVFRGTVMERTLLRERAEMRGRRRYAITFSVDEYWKGSPGSRVTLYGLDPGTDCMGDGGYEVGKNYLVFASEATVTDVVLDDFFWYGWADVLPEGSKMLVPAPCQLGGEASKAASALRELGKGGRPAKSN
jgi:hypothetical protein